MFQKKQIPPPFLSSFWERKKSMGSVLSNPKNIRHRGDSVRGTIIIVSAVLAYFVSGSLI
jgi:hypothetical protein